MIHTVSKISRATITAARTAKLGSMSFGPSVLQRSPRSRLLHDGVNSSSANPVTLQMINYALSHARSQKSEESYAQGMLVLEQCLSTQTCEVQSPDSDNSRGMVLLAMSTLFSDRGNFEDAIEKLHRIQDLSCSSIDIRVAALEALVGLHLELGQDDTSSVLADKCLGLLGKNEPCFASGNAEVIHARAYALKGLVELVRGDIHSAESFFQGPEGHKGLIGSAALSYGEFLHCKQSFSVAKELYQSVIQQLSNSKGFYEPHALAACNMFSDEVFLAATCALGQLEAHLGNFGVAEEILTRALTKTEEHFGSHHPKIGVILTCIALMFRRKAMQEHSSSLLIQEGLFRRAIELLKAPPLETKEAKLDRTDILTLAKGGYAEALSIQQNRKDQGEQMKSWSEATWRNCRLSLAEALEVSEPSSKVVVVDARISRAL